MTRSNLLMFSLLSALTALSMGDVALAQPMSAMERAEAALVHHDYDGAIGDYTEALGFNMNNTAAYFKRGQCYYYLKKYAEALSDFEYMLKASPTDTQALLWSGTAEAKLGQEQKAFDYYERAIRSQPALAADFVKKQGNLKSQTVNPRNEGAVSAYERAVAQYVAKHPELGTINSSVPETSGVGSTSAGSTGSNIAVGASGSSAGGSPHSVTITEIPTQSVDAEASNETGVKIAQLDREIKDDPSNALLRYRRGLVNKRLGHPDKALVDFSEAINLDPMKSRFYLARARLYHDQNQLELSQADVKKAQSVDPTVPLHINFSEGN